MSSTLRKRKRNEREKGEEHSDAESQASNMSNFDNLSYQEERHCVPLSFGCSVRQKMEVVFKSEVNLGPLKADLKIDRDEKQLGALIVHNHSTGNVDLQYIGRYIARSSKIAEKFPEEDVAVIEDYMCRHPACAYMFIELDNEGKEKFYRSRLSKLDRFLESSSGSSSGCSSEKKRSKRYRA